MVRLPTAGLLPGGITGKGAALVSAEPAGDEPGSATEPACVAGTLLFDDRFPWYRWSQEEGRDVSDHMGTEFNWIVGRRWAEERARRLAEALVDEKCVVILPLMSGALLWDAVSRVCDERDVPALLIPLSKHPFVTLSADDPQMLEASCSRYQSSSARLEILPEWFRRHWANGRKRVVMLDANTAAGRDAGLLRSLIERWIGRPVEFVFGTLINETTESLDMAPGWRSGAKFAKPDLYALRLVGSNTKYLSHLRFLTWQQEAAVTTVRRVRARYPRLTAFWDEMVPVDLRYIHGHHESVLDIHKERLHVRFGPDDGPAFQEFVRAGLAAIDRGTRFGIGPAEWARRTEYIDGWHARAIRLARSALTSSVARTQEAATWP